MAVLLKRNTKVFISLVESGWTIGNTTRLNILDNFSYTQSSGSDSATRSTIGPSGDRGLISYVQETAPADFSFTTYLSTFSGILSDELLWRALTNKTDVSTTIDFTESNVATLLPLFVYFEQGSITYKISNSVITGAAISLNLEGIPTIEWSGQGTVLSASISPTTFKDEQGLLPETISKLTTVAITRNAVNYTLALSNFSIDLDNGIIWSPRTKLGLQIIPTVYSTGARVIAGNLKFFLRTGALNSVQLLNDLLADNLTEAGPDKFASVTVSLGNKISLSMPNVLLEGQDIGAEEAITLDVPFTANQTSPNIGDELTITIL